MSRDAHNEADLPGTPSDQVPEILTTGRGGISILYNSMAERHPDGADADYLRWHTLDHRPEQFRLNSLRAALRVVSTPACREARAVSSGGFDAVDHVMTYGFADTGGLDGFAQLSTGLRDAGRSPFILNPVQRGVYRIEERVAAPRVKIGADVLPWFPVTGLYLLIEEGAEVVNELSEVPGVAGVWSGSAEPSEFANAGEGQRMTYCFLDDDPVAVAGRLEPVLKQRWETSEIRPLLAAPFYAVVPHEWDRYLP